VRRAYPWVIAITISWWLVALVAPYLRFGHWPAGADAEDTASLLLGFLLVGVISGLVLISLLRRMRSRLGRVLVIASYTLAAPFGYFFGIVGPQILEGIPGARLLSESIIYFLLYPLAIGLYGSIPPICGAVAGLLIGRIRERGA
jgi:hypothetical protein